MLHSRRKAEIEILTAVDFTESQVHGSNPTITFCSAGEGVKLSEPYSLFLYYLSSKINSYVKSASSQRVL